MGNEPYVDEDMLTAYALGELDERQRRTVEEAVGEDPKLARELADIQRLCRHVNKPRPVQPAAQLGPEPAVSLEDVRPNPSGRRASRPVGLGSMAGAFALAAAIGFVLYRVGEFPGLVSKPKTGAAQEVSHRPASLEELLRPAGSLPDTPSTESSYATVRRFLREGRMPPRDTVRVEEMLNWFAFDAWSSEGRPVSLRAEVATAPWSPQVRLVWVVVHGQRLATGAGDAGERTPLVGEKVSLQLGFNPKRVSWYRRLGAAARPANERTSFERHWMGRVRAGKTASVLYEVVPPGIPFGASEARTRGFRKVAHRGAGSSAIGGMLSLTLRYQPSQRGDPQKVTYRVVDQGLGFREASRDFRFASAVAAFGMLLRQAPPGDGTTYRKLEDWAREALASEPRTERLDFLDRVREARTLAGGGG